MWEPHDRPMNIFKGKSHWQQGILENAAVARLAVLPGTTTSVPESFSVVCEPSLSAVDQALLPFDFLWQQSMPGRFDFYFRLDKDLKCVALGERFSGLNVRGEQHTLIATDQPVHTESSDSLYQSIPFFMFGKGERWFAIYIDSPAPSRFDLDSELTEEGHISLFTRRPFHAYLFGPATIPHLVAAFTKLVGRSNLPPLWSLGHQQCRWSYADENTVEELAEEFRRRKVPCDTLVLDIDYMEEYRLFTTSQERFPHFQQLISKLAEKNFRLVTIVDPGIKEDPQYKQFTEGLKKDLFCKTPNGELFIEKVWPGLSAFPDFVQPAVRKWWAEQLKFFTDAGVAGIWNDMNEPAFFGKTHLFPIDTREMPPLDEQVCTHKTGDGVVGHLEMRNLYGMLMCQATYEGLLSIHPNERPFILTRSGTAGVQRYAAVWLGDNTSWYLHLSKSIPMLLNMGLSGVPFVGVDIGGFWKDALPEILIRWYETGIFYPFFRNHCCMGFRGQEAFAYAPGIEDKIRKLIETRYRLLPYIRNLFWEHVRTGAPLMRPLMWHYPKDEIACDIDDEFMLGRDILVAPILERAREHRVVYLPEGNWYHFESNQKFEGKRAHAIKLPLGTVPAFVREGALLPLAEIMQHTGEYYEKRIVFHAYGDKAACTHFEDDGLSLDYNKGAFNEYEISVDKSGFHSNAKHRGFKCPQQYGHRLAGGKTVTNVGL